MKTLPDVQAEIDRRGITINRVGVSGIAFPLSVKQRGGGSQTVHAIFDMYGSLFHTIKGTNMSRPAQILQSWSNKILSGANYKDFVKQLRFKLQAEDVYASASFNYFIKKLTPVTKLETLMSYGCRFIGSIYKYRYKFILEVKVPITSVCPCSKEMSLLKNLSSEELGVDSKLIPENLGAAIGAGAHNQRGIVTVQVMTSPIQPGLWIEDAVRIVEDSSSCELYPILKRPDEKYVTERGYKNPKFVEDIARDVTVKFQKLKTPRWVRVKVENYESIHAHQAVCYIERVYKGKRWHSSNRGFY